MLLRKDRLDASLTFRNPFHFYRELQQAQRANQAFLGVTVAFQDVRGQEVTPLQAGERLTADVLALLIQANSNFDCSETEDTCRHEVKFPEAAKDFCVTLDGFLFAGDKIGQIRFKTSDRICAADGKLA